VSEPVVRRITLDYRLTRFDLPPVSSALIVGRRASIGSKAIEKALQEMMPGMFVRLDLEHPIVESILIRASHLRAVPQEHLLRSILRQVEAVMDATDTVHLDLRFTLHGTEDIEL